MSDDQGQSVGHGCHWCQSATQQLRAASGNPHAVAACTKHRAGPFFVMLAGQPKKVETRIYVFGEGATIKDAHRSAEAHFRRETSAPSSVHVQTEKLTECATIEEAARFVDRLTDLMAKHQAEQELARG